MLFPSWFFCIRVFHSLLSSDTISNNHGVWYSWEFQSKNKVVCENAMTWIYSSWMLPVNGSCFGRIIIIKLKLKLWSWLCLAHVDCVFLVRWLWYTVRWMSPQVLVLVLPWLVWLLLSTSAMKRDKMCCFSLTTSSVSLKLALRCVHVHTVGKHVSTLQCQS